jgi:hypothetical protein
VFYVLEVTRLSLVVNGLEIWQHSPHSDMPSPWSIPELRSQLTDTIRELAVGDQEDAHWSTLVALACLNHDFSDSAITSLWHEPPYLDPLLRLTPSFADIMAGLDAGTGSSVVSLKR